MDVEIDESLFTRRKNHQGRVLPHQWVFGGYCRYTKECFVYPVEDRSAATLLPIIANSVIPGSNVPSDLGRTYNGVGAIGFQHFTVNHSLNFVDPNTGSHTHNVERSWKSAKELNKRHNGTHRSMLDSYFCEYMWRQRHKDDDLFEQVLADIAVFWPPV